MTPTAVAPYTLTISASVVQGWPERALQNGILLANTIHNRNLPFTSGMPPLGLATVGLGALIAGISVMRRAR